MSSSWRTSEATARWRVHSRAERRIDDRGCARRASRSTPPGAARPRAALVSSRNAPEDGPADVAARGRRPSSSGAGCPPAGASASACATVVARLETACRFMLVAAGRARASEPNQHESRASGPHAAARPAGRTARRGSRRRPPCTLICLGHDAQGLRSPPGWSSALRDRRCSRRAATSEPVAVAVGEAPGDVAVGAGHQQRRPGQRHADRGRAALRCRTRRSAVRDTRWCGTRWPRCMSLATSAAPVRGQRARRPPSCCCRRPARRRACRATRGAAGAARDARRAIVRSRDRHLAADIATCRRPPAHPTRCRADSRNCRAHFQPAAHSGQPRRALISRRRIPRRNPLACRSHHIAYATRIGVLGAPLAPAAAPAASIPTAASRRAQGPH